MKKLVTGSALGLLLLLMLSQHMVAQKAPPLEIGVNVNERPHWLKPSMLEQSRTKWVRAFIEASHYITGERNLDDDFRVEALKAAADDDYKVLLSIKWNLKEAGWRTPEPGSRREQQWFDFTTRLLEELEGDLSILVLVNEITIDTPEKDLQPDGEGEIPFVRFQKRLLDHVSRSEPRSARGYPLPIYAGGFTRLDLQELQEHPANRAMFRWINEDERLAGADFHMHQPDYKTTLEAAQFIRNQIPDKPLIVTEFSFVWKWKAHLGDEIGRTESGRDFADRYGLDPGMTVAEYCTQTFRYPVPESQWHEFLASQPWFEPSYLDIMGRLMERYGVAVATYAFTQNPENSGARNITESTNPWFIHQVLMPQNVRVPGADRVAKNYGIFDSFVRWQNVTDTLNGARRPYR